MCLPAPNLFLCSLVYVMSLSVSQLLICLEGLWKATKLFGQESWCTDRDSSRPPFYWWPWFLFRYFLIFLALPCSPDDFALALCQSLNHVLSMTSFQRHSTHPRGPGTCLLSSYVSLPAAKRRRQCLRLHVFCRG